MPRFNTSRLDRARYNGFAPSGGGGSSVVVTPDDRLPSRYDRFRYNRGRYNGVGVLSVVVVPHRDRDGFRALVAVLKGLDLFRVIDATLPGMDRATAGDRRVVVVSRPDRRTRPVRQSFDGSDRRLRRVVPYELTIRLDADRRDDAAAYRDLDRLQCAVNNALEGVPLGGFTPAHLSRLEQDAHDASAPPLYARVVRGAFGYVYDLADGLSTDE